MNGTTLHLASDIRFVARCDFCGKRPEHIWLLFESSDGKNHICNECVQEMMETMYCIADGIEGGVEK